MRDDSVKTLEQVKKEHIEFVLFHCAWRKREAARVLGVGHMTVYRYMKRYGLPLKGPVGQ